MLSKKILLVFTVIVFTTLAIAFVCILIAYLSLILKLGDSALSFLGSIVGGGITLAGVILTIRHSDKISRRESIPRKLFHLENVIMLLEKEIDEMEVMLRPSVFSYKEKKDHLVEFDNYYKIVKLEAYTKIFIKNVNQIRTDIFFVDSEIYKLFGLFKMNVENLYSIVFRQAEDYLWEFNEILYEEHPEMFVVQFEHKYGKLGMELEELLAKIKKEVLISDAKLLSEIHHLYTEFKYELELYSIKLQYEVNIK